MDDYEAGYKATQEILFEIQYWKQLHLDLKTVPARLRKINKLTRSRAIKSELHGIIDTLEAADELIRGRTKALEARTEELRGMLP